MKKVYKKLLFKKKHIAKKLIEVLKVRPVRLTVKHCIDLINLILPDISYHGFFNCNYEIFEKNFKHLMIC